MQCRKAPCKYHGFFLLEEWCRHPDHLVQLTADRAKVIKANGGKCRNFIDWEVKVLPNEEPPWPMPVVMEQMVATVAAAIHFSNRKGDFMHHVHKTAETGAENDARAA